MSRRFRFRLLLALGLTAIAVDPQLVSLRPRPAAAAATIRVMQYNICGAICNHGVVARPGPSNDVVDDVRNRIVGFRPHIVMLHETCAGQFDQLKNLLRSSGWPMNGVFRKQRNDGRCKGGLGFGDAVLTAGHMGATEVLQLPDRGGEDRAVLCLNTNAGGPVLACTLHLVTGKHGQWERQAQLNAAARALNGRAAGRAVIVGGDFNTTPGGMGAFLNPANGGQFFDVDPEKAPTRGTKIDYVLFSRKHHAGPSGGPLGTRFSDHRILLGHVTRH